MPRAPAIKLAFRYALAAFLLAPAGIAAADQYEDQCVLASARLLPTQAKISTAKAIDASSTLLTLKNKDPHLRWIRVDLNITIADREMSQSYLCAKQNANGDFTSYLLLP